MSWILRKTSSLQTGNILIYKQQAAQHIAVPMATPPEAVLLSDLRDPSPFVQRGQRSHSEVAQIL